MKARLLFVLCGIFAAYILLESNEIRLNMVEGLMSLVLLVAFLFRTRVRRFLGTDSLSR
jgi:hypothetical protein